MAEITHQLLSNDIKETLFAARMLAAPFELAEHALEPLGVHELIGKGIDKFCQFNPATEAFCQRAGDSYREKTLQLSENLAPYGVTKEEAKQCLDDAITLGGALVGGSVIKRAIHPLTHAAKARVAAALPGAEIGYLVAEEIPVLTLADGSTAKILEAINKQKQGKL